MEHIRKALEQAEKERALARGQQGAAVTAGSAAPVDRQAAAAENVAAAQAHQAAAQAAARETGRYRPASEVHFQRTRVVEVPGGLLERNRLVAALPHHKLTDAYRMLRTRVLHQMQANRWKTLAITSPKSGCGKTLTAINLAISLAREVNHTVLLVDLDLRNPSIHRYFGYEPEYGLSDFIHDDVDLSEILFSPGVERLVVLPGREPIMNSSETLSSPKMVSLITELKSRYPDRLVICDLPPILATDDALTFAPYTDAMLMIAEAGGTQREDLEQALNILKDVPLAGTVLNKSQSVSGDNYLSYGPR